VDRARNQEGARWFFVLYYDSSTTSLVGEQQDNVGVHISSKGAAIISPPFRPSFYLIIASMANQWVSLHKRTTRVPCMGKEANIIERLITRLLPASSLNTLPGVFWFLPPELKVHPLSFLSKQCYMWMNLRQHPSAAAKSPTDSSTSHPSTRREAPPTSRSWMNPGLASNHPFSEGGGGGPDTILLHVIRPLRKWPRGVSACCKVDSCHRLTCKRHLKVLL
jgi:hypothetical protein